MGNLHEGIYRYWVAKAHADKVITSIYVNPLQFAPEDFDKYPRTHQADLDKLAATGLCDAVFMPQRMYADTHATEICPHGVARGLEGASRPHFFTGVATVVFQLFIQTDADKAVFGEKDFQQLRVIQQMVSDLHMRTQVIAAPTCVSRRTGHVFSQWLSRCTQRAQAPALSNLKQAANRLRTGDAVEAVLATKGCADFGWI